LRLCRKVVEVRGFVTARDRVAAKLTPSLRASLNLDFLSSSDDSFGPSIPLETRFDMNKELEDAAPQEYPYYWCEESSVALPDFLAKVGSSAPAATFALSSKSLRVCVRAGSINRPWFRMTVRNR